MRLYLDTAPVIYTVEQVAPYAAIVDARLATEDLIFVVSELTLLECRVQPMRNGDTDLLQDFDEFFANAVSKVATLSRDVLEKATEIRAHHGFKTPDSIHLAAALVSSCDAFYTNNSRLNRCPDLTIDVVGT
ncbi:MAG TPA: type II toxin-antitoxin system VapC family toxin [Abditibacteriaceae bacterium]